LFVLKLKLSNLIGFSFCPFLKLEPKSMHFKNFAGVQLAYLELVDLLAPIGHFVAYHGANVFNHHGVLLQILRSVQTQALNARPGQINVILPLGLQASILGRLGVDELLAVRRVELSGKGALVGLGHAGAV